jgi:nicotinate dehydrogenase subunit B
MAGWNLLFLCQGPYRPDPAQSAGWNRGAYLVLGVGHCGACHTPRNIMGAEQKGRAFAGTMADSWYAPPLNGNSPALVPWTAQSLTAYLSRGHEPQHGIAGGPMADVAANLGNVPSPTWRRSPAMSHGKWVRRQAITKRQFAHAW